MQFTPLQLLDRGEPLAVTFFDMLTYHGHAAPGGVAHATAVLQRTLPLLSRQPIERREIRIETSFGGPGARDAFEMATRAVTEGRYAVDPSMAKPERGKVLQGYVFRVSHRDASVTVQLRDGGFVVEEYITLSAKQGKSAEDEFRLRQLKLEMTTRIITRAPEEVYEMI